jgi:hypothetical protein
LDDDSKPDVAAASGMRKILFSLTILLVVLALTFSIVLLASDSHFGNALGRWARVISALPLLAAGLSFLIVQLIVRPRWVELLKNLLLAGTFLLWGSVQLMTQNLVAKRLADVVIALYVADLAWTILAGMKSVNKVVEETAIRNSGISRAKT